MKFFLALLALAAVPLNAQPAAPTNTLGTVTVLNAGTITLKTDAGPEVVVTPAANAGFRRIAPGETDITKAAVIAFKDIAAGDRVLARGQRTDQNVSATLIAVISKSDLSTREAAERSDWTRRGVLGIAVGTAADSVTIRSRTPTGPKPITIVLTPNAIVRRYASGSVSFTDARTSTLSEIKPGDQVRARGERNADGGAMKAEEIIYGTFKTIAAVVVSVDPSGNEIKATDLDSKRILSIVARTDSNLRRLPPPVAQTIAAQVHSQPGQANAGVPQTDLQQLLDKSPAMAASALKAGDAIVITCTPVDTGESVVAITLLAGVEPILTKPGSQKMSLGNWSLDLGQ